MAQHISGSF